MYTGHGEGVWEVGINSFELPPNTPLGDFCFLLYSILNSTINLQGLLLGKNDSLSLNYSKGVRYMEMVSQIATWRGYNGSPLKETR